MRFRCLLAAALAVGVGTQLSIAQIPPAERTADLPDSWLVLYNANDSESIAWKDWYLQQWAIPAENALGLNVSTAERIQRDPYRDNIEYFVRDYLNAHAELKAKVMGIIVGFRVPGNYYVDDTHPPLQDGGGWSVVNNLQDLTSLTWYQRPNPHYFVACYNPIETPLTKAALTSGIYLGARLDGPTLADVQALTLRAKAISQASGPPPTTDRLYYDYSDVGAPPGNEWLSLRTTVESELLNEPPWRFPWQVFESETEPTPNCAMRFCYYRLTGWNTVPWGGTPAGTRILGFAMNSWGATTVRSTSAHGGRYVPNALVNGGFAAALGATAEPWVGNEPTPATIVWCLSLGQTLGEAVFRANPKLNHMWELNGDPLLRVPEWFVPGVNVAPEPPSDLGPLDFVNGGDTTQTQPTLTFTQFDYNPDDELQFRIQIDDSADFGSPAVDFASVWLPQGPASFTVGQRIWDGGFYIKGRAGQQLAPGAYYWRVQSHDGTVSGPLATANNGQVAFTVYNPLVLTGAVSRKTHGSHGCFDLAIPLDGTGLSSGVECRAGGGSLRLIFTFNMSFTALDGALDETEIVSSLGTLDVVTVSGPKLTIELSGVPDQSCLTLTLVGLCDWAGRPLPGDDDIELRVLAGDVNIDGRVDLTDMAASKAMAIVNQPLTPETARYDVNLDGLLSLTDMALIVHLNDHAASCP